VDSGANIFVGNQRRCFPRLDLNLKGSFDGVGVMAVSIPSYDDKIFLLYPSYYSTTDPRRTVSNGALIMYAGFQRVLVDTFKNLVLIVLNENKKEQNPLHHRTQH
jgi:hypothetical protein